MDGSVVSRPLPAWSSPSLGHGERLAVFLARLRRMSAEERIRASRHSFDRWERQVWAGHYPEEVPLINGEVEWIALRLADVE